MARSLTNAYFAIRQYVINLPPLREIVVSFVIPFILAIVLLRIAFQVVRRFRRWLFPPSVYTLHKEALQAWQEEKAPQAEQILWEAVTKDSTYTPALLSLAALYTYAEAPSCAKAIKILDSDFCKSCKEFDAIRLDCQAIQAGQARMVQRTIRADQYLSLSSLPKVS